MATCNGPPTAEPAAIETNKILTKTTNRGFQIRKVPKISVEQERVLRDQLHEEIEQKTKACSNVVYDCSLPRIDGFEFCLKHILQDPKSPYKQCCFVYPRSGKRCMQPAPKKDVYTNFCFEHSRKTQLTITKTQCGTFRNVETNDTLLRELAYHVDATKKIHPRGPQSNYVDPYASTTRILNYASDDSSCVDVGEENSVAEDEPMESEGMSIGWQGQDLEESDNESVDSQNEDFLKHAGIYTTEEATVITKNKMMRLQQLYIDQIHRLHSLLKQKRRTCLQNLRVERETLASSTAAAERAAQAAAAASGGVPLPASVAVSSSVHSPTRLTPRQKALNKYLKRFGVEDIMHKKAGDLRQRFLASSVSNSNKCIYSEGGVKCGERGMPCTKYCRKHILEDKKQILYRACNIEKSGVVCQEAVPDIFENSSCVLHIELPPQREYTQKKYESDDSDDEAGPNEIEQASANTPSLEQKSEQKNPLYNQTNHLAIGMNFGGQPNASNPSDYENDLNNMDIMV